MSNRNTKICYLSKVVDGMVFREDFEADQFVSYDGWSTLQGIPTHTKDQSIAGLFSLLLEGTQDESGLPVCLKMSPPQTGISNWVAVVWFYDDATKTTDPGPYLKLELANENFVQVGPRNGVSAGFYSCNPSGNFTEDAFSATATPRTTGWHKFLVNYMIQGSTFGVGIYIDDVLVQTLPMASNIPIKSIYLMGSTLNTASDSFGYFDELRYMRNYSSFVSGIAGRRLNVPGLMTEDVPLGIGGWAIPSEINPEDNDYPVEISQLSSGSSDTDSLNRLALFLPSGDPRRAMVPGDQFSFTEIDFGRRATTFQNQPGTLGNNSLSNSGFSTTVTSGRIDRAPFVINSLFGLEWVQRAMNFFEYARQGNPFSFSLYGDDTVCSSLIAIVAPGNSQIQVFSTLNLSGAYIIPGNYYIIERSDRSAREIVLITTASAYGRFGLSESVKNSYSIGDTIRSVNFWPNMELDSRSFGFSVSEPKTLTYDWTINMREHLT